MNPERLPVDDARRTELATAVLTTLRALPQVRDVRLTGSLAAGTADHYSHVDVTVEGAPGVVDRELAESLPAALEAGVGSLLIAGWGMTPLPETYVRTLYFVDFPLLWHVDLGCDADRHVDGTDLLETYHWEQLFKMWVACVKRAIRGQAEHAGFVELIERRAEVERAGLPIGTWLARVLDPLADYARGRGAPYTAVHGRCRLLREAYL